MDEITFKAEDKVIKLLISIVSKINNGAMIIRFNPERLGSIILPESYKIDDISHLTYENDREIYENLKKAGYPKRDLERFRKLRGWK